MDHKTDKQKTLEEITAETGRQLSSHEVTALVRSREISAETEAQADMRITGALLNSTKTFGDSRLMKAVKADISKIDAWVGKKGALTITVKDFDELTGLYFSAIKNCREYMGNRNSTRQTGMERKKLVEGNLQRLEREIELLNKVRELLLIPGRLVDDSETDQDLTLRDLFIRVKIYDFIPAPEQKDTLQKQPGGNVSDPAFLLIKSLWDPSEKVTADKKQKASNADDTGKLRRVLKSIPKGRAYAAYVELQGKQVLFCSDECGVLILITPTSKVVLKENREELIDRLDARMIEESDSMKAEDIDEVIRDQKEYTVTISGNTYSAKKDIGGIQRAGNRLARFLELKTGRPATFFSNIDVSHLRSLSLLLLHGTPASEIIQVVEETEKKSRLEGRYVNTREVLDLVKESSRIGDLADRKVSYTHAQEETKPDGWDDEERSVKDFLSDMIFSQDTWEADESLAKPGERMRRMLLNHRDTLVTLIIDYFRDDRKESSVLERILDKLPVDMKKADGTDLKEELKKKIIQINNILVVNMGGKEKVLKQNRARMNAAIEGLLDLTAFEGSPVYTELEKFEKEIDALVDSYSVEIQKTITANVSQSFGRRAGADGGADPSAPGFVFKDPEERGISSDERMKRIKEGQAELERILKESMQGNSGQGKFIRTVFENYFMSASLMDRRCMFAAALKNAKPGGASILGGVLKGAGPLFQKMLQGLSAEGMPDEIREALEDVKSKLAPIPDTVVKAHLLGMVERSRGKITKIEVTQALGAASVGQTFLCRMYGPTLPKEGKDVVVKLLKPDVRNRMMREKKVMLECAGKTSKGMEATYLGQLSRIEEELDLTIEARNVVKGKIYDMTPDGREDEHVRSMKLNDMVEPTANSMVLEMAPGTTVDRLLKDTKERTAKRRAALDRKADEAALDPANAGNLTPQQIAEITEKRDEAYRERLLKMRMDVAAETVRLIKRQQYLTDLAYKWVTEGIFGVGFYHGDLHAGNMMIDDERLTVIDFGNATALDEKQKIEVTRMVGAASVGDVDGFLTGLHALLGEEFEEKFQEKAGELREDLQDIFRLGNYNSAGFRIAAALLKTQEKELEVPSAIFNFSQCQMRLQNAIEEMNAGIEDMKKLLGDIDTKAVGIKVPDSDLFNVIIREMSRRPDSESGDATVRREVDDMLYPSWVTYDLEGYRASKEHIMDGTCYAELKKYEGKDMDLPKTIDAVTEKLRQTLADVYDPDKNADDTFIKRRDIEIMRLIGPFDGLIDRVVFSTKILGYLGDVLKNRGDKRLPTDEDNRWIAGIRDDLVRKSETVQEALDAFHELDSVRGDKKKIQADIDAAADEAKECYLRFANMQVFYNDDSYLRQLKSIFLSGRFDIMDEIIERNAGADEAVASELRDAYDSFRDYAQNQSVEDIAVSPYLEAVFASIIKITGHRLRPLVEDMKVLYLKHPKTFVDVMGESIGENKTESLKRLGVFTAARYKWKLESDMQRSGV